MTDSVLIDQYLQGNVSAFNTLVWRWEKPMYHFIHRTIGNEDTAKDLCQTLFIKMFRDLKKLRDPEKLKPWLYQIALNLCRDEMRRRKRQRFFYIDSSYNDESANSVRNIPDDKVKSPDDVLENSQIGDILKKSLMAIPVEQRTIIVMKQYQDLKFSEISDILNIPVNTVKSRLYYGLKALRKILEASKLNKEVLLHEM